MTRKITDCAPNRYALNPDVEHYGIEVEAEGLTVGMAVGIRWSTQFKKYWSFHEDGSLRNGIEFVSVPLLPEQVPEAIEVMWPSVVPGRAIPSGRTGIHIHASCFGLDTDDVLRIARHYALLEPVLFNIAGADREENIFCIPWYRGDDEPRRVFSTLANEAGSNKHKTAMFLNNRPTTCKYSALNISPLCNLGTIEFRHAPTYADGALMQRWFNAVRSVRNTYARKEDPLTVYREQGMARLVEDVLGTWALRFLDEEFVAECDVERTAMLLYPKKPTVSREWGCPPMLKVKTRAAAAALRIEEVHNEDALVTERMATFAEYVAARPATLGRTRRLGDLNDEQIQREAQEFTEQIRRAQAAMTRQRVRIPIPTSPFTVGVDFEARDGVAQRPAQDPNVVIIDEAADDINWDEILAEQQPQG